MKFGWWRGGQFIVQAHWARNIHDDVGFEDYTCAFNPASGVMGGDPV